MEIITKSSFLPNPDAEREPCVPECDGCNRRYERIIVTEGGMIPVIDDVCISYTNPAAIHRLGCPMKSNKVVESTNGKKKINPLKLSKRLRRRGIR